MKARFLLSLLTFCFSCGSPHSEAEDIEAIRQLLETQAKAWSNNDLHGFMAGYVKSEDLIFFGSGGIHKGYQATLERYQKSYPNKAHMGTLEFTLRDITKINKDAYWVMGEYHLTRKMGNANGTFMIVLKRIQGKWKIIGDSSC